MRCAAIADNHGKSGWAVPPCDVFIHAGDLTAGVSTSEAILWLGQLRGLVPPGVPILIVPGNHDRAFEKDRTRLQSVIDDHRALGPMHILIDEGVEIGGMTFYGSPWTPPFMDWHFMAEESRLEEMYKQIPMRLNVLITHGPPRGILDPGHLNPHAGSEALYEAVRRREIEHHVFGHLHGAGGCAIGREPRFYNVAACNEAYQLVNQPAVFDL